MSKKYRLWVKEYQDQAWTVARYILKDAQEAEDATQEAFVKLWDNRDSIDPKRVKAWLMKVTRNGCLDRLRRRRHNVEFDESYMAGDVSGPMQDLATSETREWLKQAIGGLKEPYRSLVVLRDVNQHSYEEVAGMLELNLAQVKTYLHRARKQLREQLAEVRP
ncbi:MAG: RNA polymerase sigma factor [Xanthomonadales bacterium]|nr:RNA polymerase sigma factor [Xanthomonadales bacterium]